MSSLARRVAGLGELHRERCLEEVSGLFCSRSDDDIAYELYRARRKLPSGYEHVERINRLLSDVGAEDSEMMKKVVSKLLEGLGVPRRRKIYGLLQELERAPGPAEDVPDRRAV